MQEAADGPFSLMMRELITLIDVAALFTDPIFYGIGAPLGNGKLVVIIPGLFGNDFYLQPLHKWLRCAGYSPVESSLNFNAGCLQRLSGEVMDQISSRLDGGDASSIALIGHSRGGALAWALASHFQAKVSHLVMLGSPVASLMASVETGKSLTIPVGQTGRTLMRISALVRQVLDPDCDYPSCGCSFVSNIMRPLSPHTSILSVYGRDDLIVPKEAQITEGEILEVNATHLGLVYNPEVYHAMARFLSRNGAPEKSSTVRADNLRNGSVFEG